MDVVDLGDQIQGLISARSHHSLRALPKDHADIVRVVHALFMRVAPQHLDATTGRHQDSRQHFDRGGFARAVHAYIADDLACIQRKVNFIHRRFILKLRMKSPLTAPPRPGFFWEF